MSAVVEGEVFDFHFLQGSCPGFTRKIRMRVMAPLKDKRIFQTSSCLPDLFGYRCQFRALISASCNMIQQFTNDDYLKYSLFVYWTIM